MRKCRTHKSFFSKRPAKSHFFFPENGSVYFSTLKPSQIFEFSTIYPSFDMWIMQELRITLHQHGQSCYNGENRELSQRSSVKTKKWQIIHHFVLTPLKGDWWPFWPESMTKLSSKNGRKFALYFGHGENGTHFR